MRIKTRTIAKVLALLCVILVVFSVKMLFERGNRNRSFDLLMTHETDEKEVASTSQTENSKASFASTSATENSKASFRASLASTSPTENSKSGLTARSPTENSKDRLTARSPTAENSKDIIAATSPTENPKARIQRIEFSHRKARQFVLGSEPMSSYTSKTAINTTCLNLGTRFSTYDRCICRKGWLGESCSIPEAVHYSFREKTKLKLRRGTARRVIYATMFNIEFEMIETILNEHYELVDVFIFLESTFTAFGSRKPLRLLPRLHRGYLKKFAPKIMYLYLDHFPTGARKVGFKADSYLRGYLGTKGLPNIHNLRDDDIFLVFDTDELPTRDVVAFSKFHDGYPEPFGLRLRWSVFGFFWKNDRPTQVTVGCTLGMLKTVYNNDSNTIRAIHLGLDPNLMPNLESYKKSHLVQSWFMGEDGHFAGWHCSSCLKPEGIRIKFMSAQNADHPRWGSIPEKMDLKHITSLVKEGKWFDGGKIPESNINSDSFFAPQYILENAVRFKYLLVNPYVIGGTR